MDSKRYVFVNKNGEATVSVSKFKSDADFLRCADHILLSTVAFVSVSDDPKEVSDAVKKMKSLSRWLDSRVRSERSESF